MAARKPGQKTFESFVEDVASSDAVKDGTNMRKGKEWSYYSLSCIEVKLEGNEYLNIQ